MISREQKLVIALLKEKLEKLSGKEVIFESKTKPTAKELQVKKLIESLEKISGKKVIFENEELEEVKLFGKEINLSGPSEADVRKSFLATIAIWAKKGYKSPTQVQFDDIMVQAKADKLKGKLGVDNAKNIIYRPVATINMVPGAGHSFGGGAQA